MNGKDYRLIIFDWDGTLMDSIGRIVSAMRATATTQQLPVPSVQAVRDIIGLSLEPAIERLFGRLTSDQHAAFLAQYRDQYVDLDPTPTPLFPGVETMLHNLREQGYLLAIATGKARRGLDRVLTETALQDVFHFTRCADESISKPHPQMLHELMAAAQCSADETLMIGDSVHDLKMARAAKVDALGVDFGTHEALLLQQHQPLAVLSSWQQLNDYLPLRAAAVRAGNSLTEREAL
ncbi:HAD-IIIA family hydrolase [Pseudidiomarina insulisalsae]|uniref:HAD family hydrolase n=1 Tax=Pseudidiomarina insulisalsae TaxID=575789 RepID=A0A432YHD9_9GAMM|nr:HAD-IIIA family hydrolase [Pseudidiomarina insulisalsae]RUO60363.1 HAD family hydrolase [Pseudidiomarina insulisalsae]